MKPKIRKATGQEKADYLKLKSVYPLYGFVEIDDPEGKRVTAYIEDLRGRWAKDDPQYEVMVPNGYTMDGGVHSLLCYDLKDLKDRCYSNMEKCNCDSGCSEFWEGK